jgi:hypothetical protein
MLKTALLASFLVAACTTNSSTTGQAITCDTDPSTGVVTRCEPSDGTPPGPGQCGDIDEDGNGQPGDDDGTPDQGGGNDDDEPGDDDGTGDDTGDDGGETEGGDDGGGHGGDDAARVAPESGRSHDSDDDGVDDDHDCDEQPGGDDNSGDLPYDIKLELGQTTRPIFDAFAEKGAQPAAILSVEVDAGGWRADELVTGAEFVVDQADCDHEGNRDVGRDRIFVTWQLADGSTETDHLDVRYCE